MSLSGSYDYTQDAKTLIKGSFEDISVFNPTVPMMHTGLSLLELKLKALASSGSNIAFPWARETYTISMFASTQTYTLDSKILSIDKAVLRDASNNDTSINILAGHSYRGLPTKQTEGVPSSIYIDRQLSAYIMYVYPIPEDGAKSVILYAANRIQDVDNIDNNLDLDSYWLLYLRTWVASRLALSYRKDDKQLIAILNSLANDTLKDVLSVPTEDAGSLFIGVDR